MVPTVRSEKTPRKASMRRNRMPRSRATSPGMAKRQKDTMATSRWRNRLGFSRPRPVARIRAGRRSRRADRPGHRPGRSDTAERDRQRGLFPARFHGASHRHNHTRKGERAAVIVFMSYLRNTRKRHPPLSDSASIAKACQTACDVAGSQRWTVDTLHRVRTTGCRARLWNVLRTP